jgi:hypothetical protein
LKNAGVAAHGRSAASGAQCRQKQEPPLPTLEVYMKREEKILYHQIHPLRFLTDLAVGFIALPLLWRHRLRAALLVTFVHRSSPPS